MCQVFSENYNEKQKIKDGLKTINFLIDLSFKYSHTRRPVVTIRDFSKFKS